MSLVVSDSGPIHYLVLCEVIEVIPKLYGRLVIPTAVVQELIHAHAPPTVSQWIRAIPPWASVQSPLRGMRPASATNKPALTSLAIAGMRVRITCHIRSGDEVVIFNTGAAQKYLEAMPLALPRLDKDKPVNYVALVGGQSSNPSQ